MKRKLIVSLLSMTAIALSVWAAVLVVNKNNIVKYVRADNNYSINAFAAYSTNPGSQVTMRTSENNEVVLSADHVNVVGETLVVEPDGYLQIARDESKEFLNALTGLSGVTTDFVGRIEYSYLDKVATYDDAISGNYTFTIGDRPAFVKLYNDSDENRELTSLTFEYDCETASNSIAPAYHEYSVEDGVVTATSNVQVSFSMLKEAKKGIIEFSAKNNKASADNFLGAVVGLTTTKTNWYQSGASYVWGVLGAKGGVTLTTVNSAAYEYFEGDDLSRHTISDYVADTFVPLTLKFDVDNQYYALYQGNRLMAVDTTSVATGSKIGFRLGYSGMAIKDIVLKTNIDFHKEVLQRRTKNQLNVYNDGNSNIYEATVEDTWHYFNKILPATGTITFDYRANSFASNWVEGLMFSESMDIKAISSGKAAVFGTGKANSLFNSIVFYDKGDGSYGTNWMGSRSGKFEYTLGATLHLKLDYDLTNLNWTLYKKDSVESEWTQTGTFSPSAAQNISGLQYLGFRMAASHETDDVNTTISNLVVNGEAW